MIRIKGTVDLRVAYSLDVNMTEEEWDSLTYREQSQFIDYKIDYNSACRDAEVIDVDVYDVMELE